MTKQNLICIYDPCRVNIGDSVYFGPGRRRWVDATVDAVHREGNGRRYDVTVVADGSKHYGVHSGDVKKRAVRR